MSEKDKREIMEALRGLPEEKKQFLLGYCAGVTAKAEEVASETTEDPGSATEEVKG